MRIRILESAQIDLLNGFSFYEKHQERLGHYFLDSLYSDIDSLLLYAGIHPQKFGFYWLLSKRFPYAVYYTLNETMVSIYAVLDCRQDPKAIEKRMHGEKT